jgi:hypothetical protein
MTIQARPQNLRLGLMLFGTFVLMFIGSVIYVSMFH